MSEKEELRTVITEAKDAVSAAGLVINTINITHENDSFRIEIEAGVDPIHGRLAEIQSEHQTSSGFRQSSAQRAQSASK